MGWAAGSELAQELYIVVRKYLPEDARKDVATQFYNTFGDYDADDWDGTSQLEIDAEINQEDEEDEEEVS